MRLALFRLLALAAVLGILPPHLDADDVALFAPGGGIELRASADLDLLGAAPTARQVIAAYRIADAATGATRIIAVTRDTVIAFDADLRQTSAAHIGDGAWRTALTRDARQLLAVSDNRLAAVDLRAEPAVRALALDFRTFDIAVLPAGKTAVLLTDSGTFRAFDIASARILDSERAFSEPIGALRSTPHGEMVYALSENAFFEFDDWGRAAPVQTTPHFAVRETPYPAMDRFEPSAARRLTTWRGSQLRYSALGNAPSSDTVRSTALPFTPALLAPSSSPGLSYALDVSGQALARVSAARGLKVVDLGAAKDGLSVLTTRYQGSSLLQQVAGDNTVAASGSRFTLRVRALDAGGFPVTNVAVFASAQVPAAPAIQCFSNLTGGDGEADITCDASDVTEATTVSLTISDTRGNSTAPFRVQFEAPLPFRGISAVGEQAVSVAENSTTSLVVQSEIDGLLAPGVPLSITVSVAPATLSCPTTAETSGTLAQATIVCTSGDVEQRVEATVTVSDDRGNRIFFVVRVDPVIERGEGLVKLDGDNQIVRPGAQFPEEFVVSFTRDGVPQPDELLTLTPSSRQVGNQVQFQATCPGGIRTDDDGIARFTCRAGSIIPPDTATQGSVAASVTGLTRATFEFLISLEGGGGDPTDGGVGLRRVSVGELRAPLNTEAPLAFVVETTRGLVNAPGVDVYFSASGGDDIRFDPPVVASDENGIASTTITFGCDAAATGEIWAGLAPGEQRLMRAYSVDDPSLRQFEIVQGDGQSGPPGTRLTAAALKVRAVDQCGDVLQRIPVDWRVEPPTSASLSNVVDRTDGSGEASALVTLGQFGGSFNVVAAGGVVETAFTLMVESAGVTLRKVSGDQQLAAAGQPVAEPLVVEIVGLNGAGVAGESVQFAVSNGQASLSTSTVVTDGLGLAFVRVTPTVDGAVTVTAQALGQSVAFNLGAGANVPQIGRDGFTNGADFQPTWVPGQIGTLFGANITSGPGTFVSESVPLATTLAGVSVRVNGIPAPLFAVVNANGSEQINLQVPFEIATPANVTVEVNNGTALASFTDVPIVRAAPGIFGFFLPDTGDTRWAIAVHADFTLVTPDNPARPGEVLILFCTGLGQVTLGIGSNQPGPSSAPFSQGTLPTRVRIDQVDQENLGVFYAPGFIGLYQINFRVLQSTPDGNLLLELITDGQESGIGAILPVSSQ